MNPEAQDTTPNQPDSRANPGENQPGGQTRGPNVERPNEHSWISQIIDAILPNLTETSTNNRSTGNEAAEGEW